jgi:hypothetical protein
MQYRYRCAGRGVLVHHGTEEGDAIDGHGVRMGEKKNSYKVLVATVMLYFENPVACRWEILEQALRNNVIGLNWHRVGTGDVMI